MQPLDSRLLVHTPAELMTEFVRWAEYTQENPGIPFGLPTIDNKVIPMRPGELVGIVARPGHCKTAMLAYLAKQEAYRILQRGKEFEEVVVFCTWEQASEELTALLWPVDDFSATDVAWGRADLSAIKKMAVKGARVPIWMIGHGIGRSDKKSPRMTPKVVLNAIESMRQDFNVKPALILFDYIQLIPIEHAGDRIQQVTEMPILIKELALKIGAPAVVGIQAGRSVDERTNKIPEMRDCQWSSAVEQTADKLFALWRPWQTEKPGKIINLNNRQFEVSEWLLVMRLLKQRGDQGRYTWALYFEPHFLKLAELELDVDADFDF